jgi:predicted glycoside hydrolase/deacetylase ChbG (UPF0249 family)
LRRLAGAAGYRQNGHLLGVYELRGHEDGYLALLAGWMRQAQAGDLLMCHPGLAINADDDMAPARPTEYAVLSGAAFGELLAREGVCIVPFSRIPLPAAGSEQRAGQAVSW